MKLYYNKAEVGCYTVNAVGKTPAACIAALVKEYNRNFGSFKENGFKSRADWCEWHGIFPESCQEIEVGIGWTN